MHKTLENIKNQLDSLINHMQSNIPSDEPFGIAHGNWGISCLTWTELIEEAKSISDLIDTQGGNDLGAHEVRLQDYVRRIQHLHNNTVSNLWGNAGQGVPAFLFTLQGLRNALTPVLNVDAHREAVIKLKKLANQLRNQEARLISMEPRTAALSAMVERIELAYNAADQLPTDLESLSEARHKIADLVKDAEHDKNEISQFWDEAKNIDTELAKSAEGAKAVLERCETAYSAATSVGLAAAFSERSNTLSKSMWFWVIGLVGALASGSYFGSKQLNTLSSLLGIPNASTSVVVLNLLLSMLSIGAPVWFAWLATKQIGQRFRLSEDYAFKASISRAYEGFRRETARFDKEMEAKLLMSALTRLDELPLRLVETDNHGSPWQELASSNTVKQALNAVPGFSEQVKDLASRAIESVTTSVNKPRRNVAASSDKSDLGQE